MDLLAGRKGRAERALSDESQAETGLDGDEYQPNPFRYPDSTHAEGMTGAVTAAASAAAGAGAGVGSRKSPPASEINDSPTAAASATSTNTGPSFESKNTTNNAPGHPGSRRAE